MLYKCFLIVLILVSAHINAGSTSPCNFSHSTISKNKHRQIFYGKASYYGDKFNQKKTANGEIFSQKKFTAACNILPLGTWIRVTNLKNNQSVIVKINDRMHPKMKRLVDVSKIAAERLDIVRSGLAKVKIEVVKPGTKK